jgi:hypothetical protein
LFGRLNELSPAEFTRQWPTTGERMLTKSIHRSIATVQDRLVVLAPPTIVPGSFDNVDVNPERHAGLLAEMQRLRGRVYLNDGAITPQQLTADGLHQTPEDEKSWHLLMIDSNGCVDGCIWYMAHEATVAPDRLRVKRSPLADEPAWRDTLRDAVNQELATAQKEGVGICEVGGWAVDERNRCTSEGLVLALGSFSLANMLGGAICLTTATVRHCSSTILRRLGGSHLQAGDRVLPPYYDPRYQCEMELLRFDSRRPSAKYLHLIALLKDRLAEVLVIAPSHQPIGATASSFVTSNVARPGAVLAA